MFQDYKDEEKNLLPNGFLEPFSVRNNSTEMRTAAARNVGSNSSANVFRRGRSHLNATRHNWNGLWLQMVFCSE